MDNREENVTLKANEDEIKQKVEEGPKKEQEVANGVGDLKTAQEEPKEKVESTEQVKPSMVDGSKVDDKKETVETEPSPVAKDKEQSTQEDESSTLTATEQKAQEPSGNLEGQAESKAEVQADNEPKQSTHHETSRSEDETGTDDRTDTQKEQSEKEESKQSSTSSREGGDKRRGKKKRKKKHSSPAPSLRRKTSKLGSAADYYVQSILLSYFNAFDPSSTGLVTENDFWSIITSAELNLQLNQIDVQLIQQNLPYDEQGHVLYMEFVTVAHQLIISLYSGQPDAQSNLVELRSYDGGTIVTYNKKTGEIIDNAEAGIDLFEETIKDIFLKADKENKGYITKDQFTEMLDVNNFDLKPEDKEELVKTFPEGNVSYSDFQPIAKELILRVYRTRDDSDQEWVQVSTPKVGSFYVNKFTGETKRNPGVSEEPEQEATLISQAYSQIESLNVQLEQEKAHTRELENQIALTNEELEATAAQLDDTGRHLDEVNLELQLRETEVSQLQSIINDKDNQIDELSAEVAEVIAVKDQLAKAKAELEEAKTHLQRKDTELAGKDQTIDDLKMQSSTIIDQLKNAHGVIDARESSIDSLQFNLSHEQGKVKVLKEHMPSLETKLSKMMDDLIDTKKNLEEKSAILLQTRENLKKARAKNMELEKDNSKLSDVNSKLTNAEGEIRTLKSFLTSKTAMVERRKKEIQELKLRIAELESRDNRRAIILADVLEKTARTVQQQLISSPRQQQPITTSTTANINTVEETTAATNRPLSAPLVPLGEDISGHLDALNLSYQAPPITDDMHVTTTRREGFIPCIKSTPAAQKIAHKKRTHIKARTVPRLPPIRKRKSDFTIPTERDLKQYTREKDSKIHPHTNSINCQCEMCTLNRKSPTSMGFPVSGGGAALSRLKMETDQREYQLSKQLKLGMRVLVQIKKSMFDLEPQKLTGTIKYVGKVDSEYMDNKIYVGVKLDDPVGNTDGVFKGRRYFTCPALHGRMVRITNVIAVMPNRSLTYVPLKIGPNSITNNNSSSSPYAAVAAPIKHSPLHVT